MQFDWKANETVASQLQSYCANIDQRDYFQTTVLLYDTIFCSSSTFDALLHLTNEFPISRTNEQGIMNLYFNCGKYHWRQLDLSYLDQHGKRVWLYDYKKRFDLPYTIWKL